jgi:hypothetical protein
MQVNEKTKSNMVLTKDISLFKNVPVTSITDENLLQKAPEYSFFSLL